MSTFTMLAVIASITIAGSLPAQAVNATHSAIVSADPANFTPNVLDGQINAFAQIGNTIFAGGQFTQVQASTGGPVLSRSNLFSFDASTGAITSFAPTFNDVVKALAVAPDGNLLVGGYFNSVNGDTSAHKLVKLNPTSGARITAFSVGNPNGQVWDITMAGSQLIVGGRFTLIKNVARDRLAAVDPTTGNVLNSVSFSITDPHTSDSTPWVYSMAASPDGSKLVIIGNFMKVNGLDRPQAAMIDLSTPTATLANWETDRYIAPCFSNAFDTYMRDVDFSPDGSYFVIVATGGPNVGTLCDTAARWNTADTGTALQPAWVDVTGGDTLSAVAITGAVVYAGGHQRWQNNYYGGDSPGPGAVDRPGIAALDPSNGVPFSWNPTKDRGKGVFALMATNTGLWMGSDTDHVAGELRRRVAFFPLAGGKTPPSTAPYTLPGDLYSVPTSSCSGVDPSILYRVNTGGPAVDSTDCGPNWQGDDSDGAPGAAFRNTGNNSVPAWGQTFTVNGTVPASTPRQIFDSERWDPGDANEMQWNFPVPSGTHVQVRLYFINQYGGTSQATQRVFSVAVEGTTVLSNYDIVADVGNLVGTMKAFNVTSNGNIDIDFSHVTENPLINGIEIINTDVAPLPPPGAINRLDRRTFDGSTAGPTSSLNTPGVDWSTTRGIFALQGKLYSGSTDGNFSVRSFDGTSAGPAQAINLNGLTDFPVQSLSGMFLLDGQLYFTVRGTPQMFHRGFTPESQIVESFRYTVNAPSVDFSSVRGLTYANGRLYYARTDGNLYSMGFSNGTPDGNEVLVSPKSAGYDWASNGLFVFTHVVVDTDAPSAPGKPTGSSASTGTITLNWTASTDASPPITYKVFRDGDLVNAVGTTTSTTFTDTNLAPGSQHTYAISATDKLGNGPTFGPTSDSITVTSAIFSDDFSTGNFSKWTGVTRMTIDNGTGGVAPPSAQALTSAQTGFAFENLTGTFSQLCMSANVNVTSQDSNAPTLFRLRTAANGAVAKVYVNTAGILYVRSDVSSAQIFSGVALGNGWHKIEICGTVGTSGTWDLYRDGVKIVNAWAANTGTTPIGRVEIGNAQAITATINFDDVVVDQTPG